MNQKIEKRYELTDVTIPFHGRVLRQIRALQDFGRVKAGDLGGYIESERNLRQNCTAWVHPDSYVYDRAEVFGNAQISNGSDISGCACVFDNASLSVTKMNWLRFPATRFAVVLEIFMTSSKPSRNMPRFVKNILRLRSWRGFTFHRCISGSLWAFFSRVQRSGDDFEVKCRRFFMCFILLVGAFPVPECPFFAGKPRAGDVLCPTLLGRGCVSLA